MKSFVAGFAMDKPKRKLLLIRKRKPAFQNGLLNGPGGEIEGGETPSEAMEREFYEETGVSITQWRLFCRLTVPAERSHYGGTEDVEVYFFGTYTDAIWQSVSKTDEQVELVDVSYLPHRKDMMDNLHWLIPMFMKDKETYLVAETEKIKDI